MKIHVTLNGKLADLLSGSLRGNGENLEVESREKRSVKDLVQSLGIPHTEVGFVRIDTQYSDLSYILQDSAGVEIFPVSSPVSLPGVPRFICDTHLWKLARRLRLLGFNTLFNPEWDDLQLADISLKDNLILLTRDRGLLMRKTVKTGLLIRDSDPEKQVIETFCRFGIKQDIRPFSRCMICNGILDPVDTNSAYFWDTLIPKIPPNVLKWSREFHVCLSCEKVYWKGTHYEKLTRLLDFYNLSVDKKKVLV
jgi:uncharacterized protein